MNLHQLSHMTVRHGKVRRRVQQTFSAWCHCLIWNMSQVHRTGVGHGARVHGPDGERLPA